MPSYSYTAVDGLGKEKKGSVEADNREKAFAAVKAMGMMPLTVTEQNFLTKDININFGPAVTVRELSLFCRQFTSILRAGVPVNDALGMLSEQTENKGFSRAIRDLQRSIQKGETLADSMRKHKKYFSPMMINLVEAGEASGSLDISMERMSIQLEKDAKLQGTIKKAMVYPSVVLCVSIAVVILMLAYVVPSFMGMFADMDIEMPKLTLMVIAASDFVQQNLILILGIIAALVIGGNAFRKSLRGQYVIGAIGLKIPAIKNFIIKTSTSRMARTLTTLLYSGLPMVEALAITANTMTNIYVKEALLKAKEEVMKGVPLSEPLRHAKIFPAMVVHMVKIGEETGDMKEMMIKMADYYDEETELATQSLLAFLEPMIILILAVIVGTLVGAVVMPMLSLYTGLDAL